MPKAEVTTRVHPVGQQKSSQPSRLHFLRQTVFGSLSSLLAVTVSLFASLGFSLAFDASQAGEYQTKLQDILPTILLFLVVVVLTTVVATFVYVIWRRLNRPWKTESVRTELVTGYLSALDS